MRDNHLRRGQQYVRLLTMPIVIAATVLSPLTLLTTTAAALPGLTLLKPKSEQAQQDAPPMAPPSEEGPLTPDEPAVVPEYAPGTPTPTSPEKMRQSDARLTWTATGNGLIQDTYDVIVTKAADTDQATGRLSGEPALPFEQTSRLTTPELDISSLPDGTYYWQVGSCTGGTECTTWSKPVVVTIDATPPAVPTVSVTSGPYEQDVRLNGLADPATKVSVTVGDATCLAVSDSEGVWTCAFESPFDYGVYEAMVKAVDDVGNESTFVTLGFAVKELFVAPPITVEELPLVLDIVPADETPTNKVFQQPLSVLDGVDSSKVVKTMDDDAADVAPLSTDGGIVQSSEDGWQVLGMPWYLWAGLGGMLSAGWAVSSGRLLRSGGL